MPLFVYNADLYRQLVVYLKNAPPNTPPLII